MSFKKKIQIRFCVAAAYIIIGTVLTAVSLTGTDQSEAVSTFGAVFTVMGITKAVRYFRLMKNSDAMRSREIMERDERNIMIVTKARSLAFSISITISAVAAIILYLFKMPRAAEFTAYVICACTLIYLICYYIIQKKY